LKCIIKENIHKAKNIDIHKYNSDILYKMIKTSKISYEMLSKEVLLDVIVKSETNCKLKKNPLNLILNSDSKSANKANKRKRLEKKDETSKDFGTKRRSKLKLIILK